jgi:excisionase family DNA binding protein
MKLIVTPLEDLEELVKTSVKKSLDNYFSQREEQKSENLTVKETAALLNVAELTIRNYIKKGIISAERIGNRIIINRKKLEDSLKEVKSLKYRRGSSINRLKPSNKR